MCGVWGPGVWGFDSSYFQMNQTTKEIRNKYVVDPIQMYDFDINVDIEKINVQIGERFNR